ncbi:hypothetical protein D3C78_687530 [compost metagenome]
MQPVVATGRDRPQIAEQFSQQLGLVHRTVGDDHRSRLLGQQRLQGTAHRAASTKQQDAFALEAESGVDRQVPHQPGTVGVVAQQAAIGQFAQGIDRTGALRPRRQAVRQPVGLFLERHRHIGAASFKEKRPGTGGKVVEWRQHCVVVQLLRGLLGEQAVDQR